MPDIPENLDFIPAPVASENEDFIQAPVAQSGDDDFVPSTLTPEQTVTELLSKANSHSEAVSLAEPLFDNPTLRPLLVHAIADRQKKRDLRTPEDSLRDAAKVATNLPAAVGRTLWSVVTESVPAVASNISALMAGNSVERLQAVGEAGAAISGAVVGAGELVRKAGENLSDSFTFSRPSLNKGLDFARNPTQLLNPSRSVVQSDEVYAKRAEADIIGARTIRQAAEGEFVPNIQQAAASFGVPIRPEVSQHLQVAYDPQNWIPFGAGFVVGKVGNGLGLGVRAAGGVEVVAKGLQKLSEVEKAAETVGLFRRGIGATVSGAGGAAVRAADSPAITGTIAGAAALAAGAEPTTAMLASLIGAGATKRAGLVSNVLDKTGQTLVRVGDQIAGKASLGPMGRFAESAVNFVKPSVVEGGQSGLAMGLPFALSARDEQDVADVLGSSAAFGVGGHLVGQVAGSANRYFSIDSAFRGPTTKAPDSAYERPEFTHYSQDQGHPVEAKSKEVFDTLSNKGAQTVEALKKVFSKPDANGIKTEIYVLDRATSDALAQQYAGSEQGRAGFSVEIPEQKRRLVVINADSNGGISLGHEVGHAFYESLPFDQKKQLLDTVTKTLRPDDFVQLRNRYEDLFNRTRNDDGSFTQVPEIERKTISNDYAAKEYLAENFSAYLNGIPIEKFGTPRNLADRIRVSIGAALEKAGARRLTTDGSAAVRTELGYKPSAALAELYQNFIEARRLDNTSLPSVNGEAAPVDVTLPPVEVPENRASTPANAPAPVNAPAPASDSPLSNIRDVETKPVAPGFKKGDPIGEIRDRQGVLIAEDAKVLKKNENGTYEIEFIDPDSGKKQIATTDEASLTSPVTPGKVDPNKTVSPKSPLTPETPFGAATATVTPKQVENVARPEASVATPNLRAGAASKFAAKAPDNLHVENRKVLEGLMSAPRSEIPAVETDYYSAASPVQAPDAAVRTAQRKAADALEKSGEPNPFRSTFQKLFVPYRWSTYKLDAATNARLYGDQAPRQPGGIYGMSVDKVGQNLDLLRGLAKETPAVAKTLSDFGVSPEYLASNELVSDFQTYLNNQAHGYGGDGKVLTLPADTRPGTITARDPNYTPTPLSLEKRQLLNLLLNFEQQASRTAGMEFSARFAKENGIDPLVVGRDDKGRPLTDNNELRAALLKTGFDPHILNSAVENLPTENFTSKLKVRPDVALPAADVAITQAGFMPEDSQLEGFGESMREKMRAKMSKVEPTGYQEGDRLELPSGRVVEFVSDLLPKRGGARDGAQMAYVKFDDGTESSVYADDLSKYYGPGSNFMPETSRRPQGNDETRKVATDYIEKAGTGTKPHETYAPVDEATLKRIADFYESAKHEPENPVVEKAYRALAEETKAQYDDMVANGIEIEPYDGKGEPYANSAAMLQDVRDNKHLYFFLTKNAFGEGADSGTNALLEKSGIRINGHDLLYNDLFRAVHDYFGHTAEGFEFGPRGEYNAYLAHSRMFSDEAKPALAAETLAQNAWVNFGPQLRRKDGSLPKASETDFVPIAKRRFADQKNTVVPDKLLREADPTFEKGSFMPEESTDAPLGVAYHVTPTKNLRRIKKEGLLPASPKDFDDAIGVYLFNTKADAEEAMTNWLGERFDEDEPLSILKVDIRGLKTIEGAGFETVVSETIPPGRILKRADADALFTSPSRTAAFMPEAPDTPAFRKWFGGSKVVDESGNPKVVYHGTDADFTKFKRSVGDIGMHFGTSDQANDRLAYTRGRDGGDPTGVAVMPVYISIKNPLRLPDVGAWNAENLKSYLLDLFPADSGRIGSRRGSDGLKSTTSIREFIQSKGFDGVVYKNTGEVGGSEPFREAIASARSEMQAVFGKNKNGFTVEDQKNPAYRKWSEAMDAYTKHRETNAEDSYIAFEPAQIKSATANSGAYNPKESDIRYMPEAQYDAPKKLPDAIGGRPITLVHRGNSGISEIDPARFGKSGITPRSELSGAPRSYYYVKGLENKSDPVMGRSSRYEIPVSGKRIYDADTDNLDWSQQINRWKADDMLKAAGYVGLSRTRGTGKNKFQQIELFEKLKVPKGAAFLPETDDLGFNSQLERTLKAIPAKASREQIEAALRDGVKEKGQLIERPVKSEELAYTKDSIGLSFSDFLKQNPKATRQDLIDFASENRVKVGERIEAYDLQYEDYQLAGGYNYCEAVLVLPGGEVEQVHNRWQVRAPDGTLVLASNSRDRAANRAGEIGGVVERVMAPEVTKSKYTSKHFTDVTNYLAHTRFNERTDVQGNWMLFAEEIQSDLHQEGRKKGYQSSAPDRTTERQNEQAHELYGRPYEALDSSQKERVGYAIVSRYSDPKLAPDAPFKKSWPELLLKYLLKKAVDIGASKLAWTTGDLQVERYDLKVGGEGMKTFYDKVLPGIADKYLKRFGVKTESTALSTDDTRSSWREEQGLSPTELESVRVHSVSITPEMREAIKTNGQVMFLPEAPDTPEFKKWFGDWQDPKAFTSKQKGPVSMVVDWKAGDFRPLRVYHSTTGDFNAFESGRPTFDDMGLFGNVETNRHAIFFSDSPEQANSYAENKNGKPYEGAKTYPAYLDIKAPADFTRSDPWTLAEEAGVNPRWLQNKQTWELFDGAEGKQFVEGLKKAGYDGAIFKEDAVREGVTPGITFAVFEPTQIKSATGNKGTFDASNPDIRFQPETDDIRLTRPYREIAKFLTPQERSKVRKDTAADMVEVFKELPPDSEFEAASKLGNLKKGWYERAGRSLRTIFGNDTEKFVGVLAATSPRQSVQLNMEMAFDIWEKYLEAGRPEDAASIKELVKPLVGLPSRENNTVRALLGKDLEDSPLASSKKFDDDTKLSGFKVESFRRNLLGDPQASTNDAWMAQFSGISQTLFGTKAGYSAFNAKIRRVADTLDLKPAEVQETIWSFFKTLVEGTKEGRSSAETLASLTQGDILNTPEFHEELLKNPKVAGVLERLGIDTAAILNNENPAKAGADPALPLAEITFERGQDSRRVLERVVARAQAIKNQSLADETATRNRVAPTDEENPF